MKQKKLNNKFYLKNLFKIYLKNLFKIFKLKFNIFIKNK